MNLTIIGKSIETFTMNTISKTKKITLNIKERNKELEKYLQELDKLKIEIENITCSLKKMKSLNKLDKLEQNIKDICKNI
jgi:archaellum component FlaC